MATEMAMATGRTIATTRENSDGEGVGDARGECTCTCTKRVHAHADEQAGLNESLVDDLP